MTDLSNPFVLGYHGCRRSVGEAVLSGDVAHLAHSRNRWDWLGSGIYFWEADPVRGYEWAVERYGAVDAFVVGAVIHLGTCLDLMARGPIHLLSPAYELLRQTYLSTGRPLPENRATERGPSHALDCAVIETLHLMRSSEMAEAPLSFDTVRGLYQEGEPAFPGSMIQSQTHIQICVRSPERSIKGYVRVPAEQYAGL